MGHPHLQDPVHDAVAPVLWLCGRLAPGVAAPWTRGPGPPVPW